MHGSAGLHSAMAIKRQRRIREQAKKRAMERERRLSSRTDSIDSMEHLPSTKKKPRNVSDIADHTMATSIGMLHIGVCFLVFGLFLIGSGLLPDDMVTWRTGGWWNELLGTGIFVTALGIFLIIINRVVSKKEEDNLNEYVQRQLTRSKSGHRLERDIETGCLTTKNHLRILEKKREDEVRALNDIKIPIHSPLIRTNSLSPPPQQQLQNGEIHLEKILEEEIFDRKEDNNRHFDIKETMSTTTTASLSPGTPSETRELITTRQFSFNSRQY